MTPTIILLIATIAFLLFFAIGNARRASFEQKERQRLEEESSTFHQVLLEHLAEWKYWQEDSDFAKQTMMTLARRGKLMREALEFISTKPSHPRISGTFVEIPGEACQRARDTLQSIKEVKDGTLA